MNSIEIFLSIYPEYQDTLDPNHQFNRLSESEAIRVIKLEQILKEAR